MLNNISRTFKIVISSNILIVTFLYVDLNLPTKETIENFSRIERSVKRVRTGKFGGGSSLQEVNLLFCKSYNIYKLIKAPEYLDHIKENQKIIINETLILSKIKYIKIINEEQHDSFSFLFINYILISFIVSFIISVLYIFFPNQVLDFLLGFSTVYIYLATLTYVFFMD